MKQVYILYNQDGYFLGKEGLGKQGPLKSKNNSEDNKGIQWVDGREPAALYRTEHKDEAVNIQFEVNALDFNLRLQIKQVTTNSQSLPVIAEEDLPPPLTVAEALENVEGDSGGEQLSQDIIPETETNQLATGDLSA